KLRSPVPFPAAVAGNGGIKVAKTNGLWTIAPDFSALVPISALANPTSKQVWVFDPVTGDYNVLTLGAVGGSLFSATSTTSVGIGTGAKSFLTQPGKLFNAGSFVTIASGANPANFMAGQVSAYDAAGNLTVNVLVVGGAGTFADWNLISSGVQGATGATGPGFKATSTTSFTIRNGSKAF